MHPVQVGNHVLCVEFEVQGGYLEVDEYINVISIKYDALCMWKSACWLDYGWCVGLLQIVPYLISMGTDSDSTIRAKADQQVQELDKKYPGFIRVTTINTRQTSRVTKIGTDRW